METPFVKINNRKIGPDYDAYIIAELSANHNQDFDQAIKIIHAAKDSGADAVKLQTYTAETMTINSDKEHFRIKGTIWDGQTLFDLYKQANTPWEWQPELKKIANELGMDLFSSPFDPTAVDFLEKMNVPAYKIASFELVDIPLITKIAETGKPIIMSTGMGSLGEIEEAVRTIQTINKNNLVLLKCTSSYPSLPEDSNLKTIQHLSKAFNVPVGLSDHTLGIVVPVAARTLGACVIEKHLTLSRSNPGPDSAFSLEPEEFKAMVDAVRIAEKSLGGVYYGGTKKEQSSKNFRRSIYVVEDLKAGEYFTKESIRSIRPAGGLHTRHFDQLIGRKARMDIGKGTPLQWHLIQ